MAMGFIKRIFTFGKGAVEETKPPEGVPEETIVSSPEVEPSVEAVEPSAPVAAAEIAEETPDAAFEPPVDIETLPLSEDDPVLEAEIETAGGPASDDAEELTRDEAGATPFEDSVAIPPSVPSGHLPQKEGDQTETKAAIDDASLTTETAEAVADEKPADSQRIPLRSS